jgi:amidase
MFNIIETSLKEIKTALDNNIVTSEELVSLYLDRIANVDQGMPKYNSILEVNLDALFIAKVKDKERSNNQAKGILHGIPVVVKDNINTVGKMHTTAGSLALKDNFAPYNAEIINALEKEGAIILGKANLTEFANFMTMNMRNGYSSLGKEVLFPYNLDKDPSGSSAGSAVSVTINVTPLAIGTETGGSIMSPSMQNGIVGMKPTMGLVSRSGIVPISTTLDTAGPMAKTVYGVAALLSAIRSNDELDPITCEKENTFIDYTKALEDINPTSLSVGINLDNIDKLSPKRQELFHKTVQALKDKGIQIIEDVKVDQSTRIYHVMLYEFKRAFNHYLSSLEDRSKCKTLEDVIAFNRAHEKEALKYGQIILEEAQYKTSGYLNEVNYIDAIKERRQLTKSLKDLLHSNNIDVIYFANYTSLGPHCGFPTMTVPIGIDEENVPVGSYLLSDHYHEETLLQVGALIEETMKGRINPIQK